MNILHIFSTPDQQLQIFHTFLFNHTFSDSLVVEQCLLWSTTKRCTISKIFQPRWHVVFFSSCRTLLNYGLVLKCVGIQKLYETMVESLLAIDTGYLILVRDPSNYLCTWKIPSHVWTWNHTNVNPHKSEWKHWINARMTRVFEHILNQSRTSTPLGPQ